MSTSSPSLRSRLRPSRWLGVAFASVVAAALGASPAAAVELSAAGQPAAAPAPVVTWTTASPATSPPPTKYAAAAYDPDTATMVMFGGMQGASGASASLSNQTWIWDGHRWTQKATQSNCTPPARQLAAMAYDPALHQLVMFGGQGQAGVFLADTWTWNGYCWYQTDQGATTAPGPREAAAMAFDRAGNLVLFGGTGSVSTQSSPTPSSGGGASVGSGTGTTAEKVFGDTWIWNGSTWAQGPSGPPSRSGAALAFDPTDKETVLFSGSATPADSASPSLLTDTWIWDGTRWTRASTPTVPPARSQAVFAAAPGLSGALLTQGAGASGALSDAWLWSSSTGWTAAKTEGNPTGRVGAAAATDTSDSVLVVFGGVEGGGQALAQTVLATAAETTAPHPPTSTPPTTTKAPAGGTPTSSSRPAAPTTTIAKAARTTIPAPTTTTTTTVSSPAMQATPGTLSLRASTQSVRPGAQVRLTGEGFAPRSTISISFHSTPVSLGQIVADPSGAFTANVSVPRGAAPGLHHFEADGIDPAERPTQLVANVYVVGAAGTSGPSVPVTAAMVALALVIPAGTWVAMTLAPRRRKSSPAG